MPGTLSALVMGMRYEECQWCAGSGQVLGWEICPACGGYGELPREPTWAEQEHEDKITMMTEGADRE